MRSALRSLMLTNFRSWSRAALALEPGAVVLHGPNGAGKTNLLEAISWLSPGKGLRGATAVEAGRRDPGGRTGAAWAVSAEVEVGGDAVRLGTGLEPGGSRRLVRIDGEPAQPGRLLDLLRPVWLTPAHDRLFLEAAAERRRFLDRLVFAGEPAHAVAVAAYERVQRERFKLLTEGGGDSAWLDALEARMATTGVEVTAARLRGVEALQAEIDSRADRPFPLADLSLSPAENDPDALRAGLLRGRERDAAAGRTLSPGPHRSDLVVAFRQTGRPAAEASTGEQKALILNIVLAQAARLARAGVREARTRAPNPIVLLDEAAAHLDASRRAALFDETLAVGLQVVMTGADRSLFDALHGRAQFIGVKPGELRPEM